MLKKQVITVRHGQEMISCAGRKYADALGSTFELPMNLSIDGYV